MLNTMDICTDPTHRAIRPGTAMHSPLSRKWTPSFRNGKGPTTGLSGSGPEGLGSIYVLESTLSASGPLQTPFLPLILFLPTKSYTHHLDNGLCVHEALPRAGEMCLEGEAHEGEGTAVVSDLSVMRTWGLLLSSYTVDS